MKKHIPNILTTYRIIVALLIPILFFYSNYTTIFILFVTAIISDTFDGVLARKWNASSTYGKVADTVGDKLFALSSCSTFIIKVNKWYTITLIIELIIASYNFITSIKNNSLINGNFDMQSSSIYGKVKTWFLFATLSIGLLSLKVPFFINLIIPFIIITSIMQIMTMISYIKTL